MIAMSQLPILIPENMFDTQAQYKGHIMRHFGNNRTPLFAILTAPQISNHRVHVRLGIMTFPRPRKTNYTRVAKKSAPLTHLHEL